MTIWGEKRKSEVLITDEARLWIGGRRWPCGTTRRRDRRGATVGRDPAQLALAILRAVTDEATAERFYRKFKWDVIAPIEANRWALVTSSAGSSRRLGRTRSYAWR